jgi:hypothetical protein
MDEKILKRLISGILESRKDYTGDNPEDNVIIHAHLNFTKKEMDIIQNIYNSIGD